MEIDGKYDGSDAQRIVAINSNKRKNRERFEELNKVFADSIEIHHATKVWGRVLTVAIPLIVGIVKLHTNPYAGLAGDDWRQMIFIGLGVSLLFGFVSGLGWGRHIRGSRLVYHAKELLLAHNEVIDAIYSLERLSDRVDQLESNPVMAVVTVDPHNNLRLKQLINNYDTQLLIAVTQLRWCGFMSDDVERVFLVDDTIGSSKRYLIQLLRSREWLNQYIHLVRS